MRGDSGGPNGGAVRMRAFYGWRGRGRIGGGKMREGGEGISPVIAWAVAGSNDGGTKGCLVDLLSNPADGGIHHGNMKTSPEETPKFGEGLVLFKRNVLWL